MAKKRKAGSRAAEDNGVAELDPRDSRKSIQSYKDVADSDDEFHLNQDEIRLGEEPGSKRRRKLAEQEAFLEHSDEEVLGYSDDDDDDDQFEDANEDYPATTPLKSSKLDNEERQANDDDEEDYKWGTSKADIYGADEIETEEQALEEEAEALRLQKKHLDSLRAADYGFDEDDWGQTNEDDKSTKDGATVTEVLSQLHITPDMGSEERLKLLQTRYPEFALLSSDLIALQEAHALLRKSARTSSLALLKLRALSAYIGSLAMYFSLLTSPAAESGNVVALPATEMRDHPVMTDLLKCRALWLSVEKLSEPEEAGTNVVDESVNVDEMDKASDDEYELVGRLPKKSAKKSRAERHAEAARAADAERRAARLQQTEADLADLDALVGQPRKSTQSSRRAKITADDSDLGEEVPLTAREAADKAQRKKSLRFYTSQIAQKANKRGAAGRGAGGDDDIPYRERLKDRQARLNAEAEKRGRRNLDIGDDLGGESDEDDHRQAQAIRADEDDEYYDLVAARTNKKKSDKAALADAQRQAALQGGHVVQEETVGEDGKRKISYMIEKNKGLTPHRKKDVRNPRVKKRKKYEEKKKKLASIKPIYKGGEGRGGYGGELSGIKKGLVKSTKL